MSSLEEKITADNSVRFIEIFVIHIDAVKISFQPKALKSFSSSKKQDRRLEKA